MTRNKLKRKKIIKTYKTYLKRWTCPEASTEKSK
jgi:transcription elongation factor Elf1